jgi:hypothetical protein
MVCRKAKYILQKSTPKIKQTTIQLAINQLFQKLKNRNTNKQTINRVCLYLFIILATFLTLAPSPLSLISLGKPKVPFRYSLWATWCTPVEQILPHILYIIGVGFRFELQNNTANLRLLPKSHMDSNLDVLSF